jgi:hypothetical protein
LKNTDWKEFEKTATVQLQRNISSVPLLRKGKPMICCKMPYRLADKIYLNNNEPDTLIETPYFDAYMKAVGADVNMLLGPYIIIVSEDESSAEKCAVMAANDYVIEKAMERQGFTRDEEEDEYGCIYIEA